MFGFGKSKKSNNDGAKPQKVDRKALLMAIDSAMTSWMDASGTDALLEETGKTRQELLDAVTADDEVASCAEDIRSAILAEDWRIWGEDTPEDTINRLYKNIRHLAKDFAELSILAKFGGYAVAEYVYSQDADGFLSLKQILSKDGELDSYTPKRDGSLVVNQDGEDVALNTQVKYLLLTSKAVPARPSGELMIIRAYPAVALRKRGWAYAGQFIARYAQPYVVGKQGGYSASTLESFTSTIFGFLNGGAAGIGAEDAIDIHQLTGDGEAFEKLERLANRRIQKLLLGRVKNSELTSGSRAAQQTDDETRQDRVSGYLDLMTQAIQHAIDALMLVNQVYGKPIHAPKGLWFEYQQQVQPDKTRAEVDKIYIDTGTVRRTKAYYANMLGWEEDHFEMTEPASPQTQMALSHMPKGGLKELLLSANVADSTVSADDDMLAHDQAILQPKIDAILSLLNAVDDEAGATGFAEFSAKLDALSLPESGLTTDIAKQTTKSYVDGVAGKTTDTGETRAL